jgi:hypothetical protein
VRPEQHTEEDVLGAADVAVAVSQAVEQQVGEDVAGGQNGQRRERGLQVSRSGVLW